MILSLKVQHPEELQEWVRLKSISWQRETVILIEKKGWLEAWLPPQGKETNVVSNKCLLILEQPNKSDSKMKTSKQNSG